MKQIDFSIIIPCFNSMKTIHRTLESIVNQDYDLQKVELIIIDDCSSDNTFEVLQGYSELDKIGLLHILSTDINLGPGTARNRGIDLSIGRYILFLDSDDTLNSFALSKIQEASENGFDIIFFDGQKVCQKSKIICKHAKMLMLSSIEKAKIILNLETDEHVIFAAYYREFILTLPRFKTGLYEDVLFSGIAYFQAKSIKHISFVLVNKYETPNSITSHMSPIKAQHYINSRLELSKHLVDSFPQHERELTRFVESGMRGAIGVTLKKLERDLPDPENFNFVLNEFFLFLSGKIDKIESLVLNHNNTSKDIDALKFYLDWKKQSNE